MLFICHANINTQVENKPSIPKNHTKICNYFHHSRQQNYFSTTTHQFLYYLLDEIYLYIHQYYLRWVFFFILLRTVFLLNRNFINILLVFNIYHIIFQYHVLCVCKTLNHKQLKEHVLFNYIFWTFLFIIIIH